MKTQNNGAMKQWVKPTVEVANMNTAKTVPASGHLDGFGATGIGAYYS